MSSSEIRQNESLGGVNNEQSWVFLEKNLLQGDKKIQAQAVAEFLKPMYLQVACPGPFAVAVISCPG